MISMAVAGACKKALLLPPWGNCHELWGKGKLGETLKGGPEKGLSVRGQESFKSLKLTHLLSLVCN